MGQTCNEGTAAGIHWEVKSHGRALFKLKLSRRCVPQLYQGVRVNAEAARRMSWARPARGQAVIRVLH